MIILTETAKQALERTERAYQATQVTPNTRALNRAETRFYAAAEALFHVLRADQSTHG